LKRVKTAFFIILIFVLFFSGCTFLGDFFLFQNDERTSTNVNLTFPDGQPSYIGQNLEVKVSSTPAKKLAYIKTVLVDHVNDKEIVQLAENTNQGVFSFKINSSKISFYVETPYQNKENGKEKWYPSKNSWYEIQDYSPPELDFSTERINQTNNEYRLRINARDNESGLKRVYYEINGVQKSLSLPDNDGEITTTLTLKIGLHQITVSAVNQNNLMNQKEEEINVTPPDVISYPVIEGFNDQDVIDVFTGETVYIQGTISDDRAYIQKIELISSTGWMDVITLDPLEASYNLLYPIEVFENQTLTVIAYNGNNYQTTATIIINAKEHKAPDIKLTQINPMGSEFEIGTEIEFRIEAQAHDDETITDIYCLLNNMPIKVIDVGNEESYNDTFSYKLRNGRNSFTVVAIDTKGAKKTSKEILITGFKVDETKPEIFLLMPDVAYKDITTKLEFIAEDFDSGVDEANISIDGNTNYILNGIDNYYYSTNWTPSAIGQSKVEVTVSDKEGNVAKAQKMITVKDPTGIKWPTIQDVLVSPNPVKLGGTVDISLNVIPPADFPELDPIVVFQVTSPSTSSGSRGFVEVQKNGNTYIGSYHPDTKGIHNVKATVQWDDNQVVKNTSFDVLSPEPTITLTLDPERTFFGDDIEVRLTMGTTNPYASITNLKMMVGESKTLEWEKIITEDQTIYFATFSTINLEIGQNLVYATIEDTFGNRIQKTKAFYLEQPQLQINSLNMIPKIGSKFMVYNPVKFEVFIDRNLPEQLKVNGEIKVQSANSQNRIPQSFDLNQAPDNHYKYISEIDWIPGTEGPHSVEVYMDTYINTTHLEDRHTELVTINPQEIIVDIVASPMNLDSITVAREVEFIFNITGIMEDDKFKAIQYAIFKEGALYSGPTTPPEIGNNKFSDVVSAFHQAGNYTVLATVTTEGGSVATNQKDFSVRESEIRKNVFYMNGNQNNLFYGKEMTFTLELENPQKLTNLLVKMFLVDEDGNKINQVQPITADPNSDYDEFTTSDYFRLYESGTFTAAASVVILNVPQINLPVMYSDSSYYMPEPGVGVLYDKSKTYYKGYTGSLDLTVTLPKGMSIQDPRVSIVTPGGGTLNPVPYNRDTTNVNVHYYKYKFVPAITGPLEFSAKIYETDDYSYQNPLRTENTIFNVVEFQPLIEIIGYERENEFIQAKDPIVELEITQVPEFFNGTYKYTARLDGMNTQSVTSVNPFATLTFNSEALYNKIGTDTVMITAEVEAVDDVESFTASGTKAFDVVSPSISNTRFPSTVLNRDYDAFTKYDINVLFNNNDNVTDSDKIRVDLYVFDGASTETYDSQLILDEIDVPASATFREVIFSGEGTYTISAKAFGTNSDPIDLLDGTEFEIITVDSVNSNMVITYPSEDQKIFYGEELRPVVTLTNISNVNYVQFVIKNSDGATKVNHTENRPGSDIIELPEMNAVALEETGTWTVYVKVDSNDIGIKSATNTFQVVAGNLDNLIIEKRIQGGLIFTNETVGFLTSYTFDNPNNEPGKYPDVKTTGGATVGVDEKVSTETTNGELRQFRVFYETNKLGFGDYTFNFKVVFQDEIKQGSTTFTVLPEITVSSSGTTSPSSVDVGDTISGEIKFTVPKDTVDEIGTENLENYITGSINFQNCDNQPIIFSHTPAGTGGTVEFSIRRTAVARTYDDDLGDTEDFPVTYSAQIDGKQVVNETKQFTITK